MSFAYTPVIIVTFRTPGLLYRKQYSHPSLEHYFRRTFGYWNVVSEEGPVGAMFLFLDCHREFFQRLIVEPSLPEHPRKLPRQCPLVAIPGKECYRFSALSAATYVS